uniref:Uncharacterized protein n=1 Tax=Arundo donax TaxID=35708 RepID=A0A0A9G3R0_ARUDO
MHNAQLVESRRNLPTSGKTISVPLPQVQSGSMQKGQQQMFVHLVLYPYFASTLEVLVLHAHNHWKHNLKALSSTILHQNSRCHQRYCIHWPSCHICSTDQ